LGSKSDRQLDDSILIGELVALLDKVRDLPRTHAYEGHPDVQALLAWRAKHADWTYNNPYAHGVYCSFSYHTPANSTETPETGGS